MALAAVLTCLGAPAQAAPPSPQAVVVAVVGETGGLNVLHQDFRTPDGRSPRYPSTMPKPTVVALPRSGSFDDALTTLRQGPLARMRPGQLYAVAGTRLLLVNVGATPYDALDSDALHATGVTDSVVGTRVGTAPDALAVVVLGGDTASDLAWANGQRWVDLASTSDYTISTTRDPLQCSGSATAHAFAGSGRVLFSSSGNTTDQPESLISPNGLPDTYLVGGVDATGSTWRPGHPEESDPFYAAGNVVRPYETGERYSYQAAAPDSFTGLTHFGGTSGATPLTAGWAARLVAHARTTLRATGGVTAGALASGPRRTARGPLADGRLTRDELVTLLHAVAVQHSGLPAGPAYAAEGYGALDASAIQQAERVLDGTAVLPVRSADDQADAAAHQVRAAYFARCA